MQSSDGKRGGSEEGPSVVGGVKGSCHTTCDMLWESITTEASDLALKEPRLASYLYSTVLEHTSLCQCISFLLSNKLASSTLLPVHLQALISEVLEGDENVARACQADIEATFNRDPACALYADCLLFFKGFHALQSYRVAHSLWISGRQELALALQARISEVFHVDIHPGALIGGGMMLDHATGIVIGETAVVGDNCSFLHGVTLGGSGVSEGDRHPKLGNGCLIGACATILGNVNIGNGVKVGAGSVVMSDVPSGATAVGVPARILTPKAPADGEKMQDPADAMDHTSVLLDWSDYII